MDTIQEHRLPQAGEAAKRRIFRNPCLALFILISFFSLYIFFTRIHPLYIHDLDDWLYVSQPRAGYPDVTDWNPTKILPETLTPVISYLSVCLIYPITGDYIQSLCSGYAVTLSLLICVYMIFAAKVLKKQFQLEDLPLTILMSIFLLAHFLPFKTSELNNQHLFYSNNVTCVFNYLIPALWNFILALYFLQREKGKKATAAGVGLLILCIYLAVFSSLWHSVIFMSLVGMRLLFALIEGIARNKQEGRKAVTRPFLLSYARENLAKLLMLCLWFVAMALEVTGQRAVSSLEGPFLLGTAVIVCLRSVLDMNRIFLASVVVINMVGLAVGLRRRKTKGEMEILHRQLELLGCMILCGTFVVLLGGKVGPNYLPRADVMISWMLWLMLMTITTLSYLVKLQPKLMYILPVLAFILFCEAAIHGGTYGESYIYNQPPAVIKAMNDDIIAQIQEADAAGKEVAEVHVPVDGTDGWPLDLNLTPIRIAQALYRHGLINRPMDVVFVRDPQKDIALHIQP